MAKRKYTKKSDYWKRFKGNRAEASKPTPLHDLLASDKAPWEPMLAGDSFYSHSSKANYSRTGHTTNPVAGTTARQNLVASLPKYNNYANIRDGMLPYDYSTEGVDVREAVLLCQKAYANIAIFRNAIDIMAEFANSDIYLEGGSKASRDFVNKWFRKIYIWKITDQFFREYYKSGNVFIYRIDGKFNAEEFQKLSLVYGSKIDTGKIPLRYIVLNPFDVIAYRTTGFGRGVYRKVLSEYEIERLVNAKTEEDVEILEALDPATRELLENGGWGKRGVSMPLDPTKLTYAFYKKQDYEPFAIPFGFPVLADLNWKMELKKIDAAICRTIENVILLITMGNTPDNGGINPQNMHAMQQLFRNESIGRVLVSDYTTKAEFIIPDLNKVIGPEKYQIVNEDIKEGLQNVIVGQERYASTMVKAEIFLERLKEARNSFLNDFLQPQIKLVCKSMGFRKYPIAKFAEIDLKDELQLHRVTTRLMELGVLPPEEGLRAIKTGIYPESSDLAAAQKKFLEAREKGYYNPLVGGAPVPRTNENGDVAVAPIAKGPNKEAGRPPSSSNPEKRYSRAYLSEVVASTEELRANAAKALKKQISKKRLSKKDNTLLDQLCQSVVAGNEMENWTSMAEECIANFDKIVELLPLNDILEISTEHELETYPAALIYHSDKISQLKEK